MCFLTERMKNWLFQGSSVTWVTRLAGALSRVYAFVLLMSSKHHYQVELLNIEWPIGFQREKQKCLIAVPLHPPAPP